ncbi:MAG: endonuclease/exonuclease/phosphatase family protein [Massilibacteroides sp.]|nr:endonuclease/exonuclease/phosphatase family protein [Massilibacteroides sp.]MDD3063430.1 endonuclease/exonuclease/phosphatase family protein [Massilibacteroides sp.]MDD4115068.1 endonuclease/exonuclease/phosphatase family protein [Massilibacteroides sp.]MDD4660465.1 endonuclease/exonuclease/phosphatase family protein [Massilibacteroides sp.]
MKPIRRFYLFTLFLFASGLLVYAGNTAEPHRLMSCNIRVALEEDEAKGFGWNNRKECCIQVIKSYNPDIICLQEVIKIQYLDLKKEFEDYTVFGFEGPDMDAFPEGYQGIAKNIILFSKNRYEYVSAGCYWLSETPLIAGSKSWNTARARHCNWVRLKDKSSGKEFRVLDLHLDHVSQLAKEKQTTLVMTESAQYQSDFPQLLAGDFNADMQNEVIRIVKKDGWIDTFSTIHGETEPGRTTHGFQGVNVKPGKTGRIDFIFSKGQVKSVSSEIVKDEINGKYPSDHFFIYTDVIIK